MAIVESGPINIKIDTGMALRALMSDPEFAEKVRVLVKELLAKRMKENGNG